MDSKTYHIKLNGKVYEVEIEEVKEDKINKEESKKNKPVQSTKKHKAISEGEEIAAPMPGNMFNILVKEGQEVRKGDVVAVLEAMKMENEIVAPVDGRVLSINVEKGQNVSLGDIILKIA